jgi:DNA-binding CsgD family transcriptional regulator
MVRFLLIYLDKSIPLPTGRFVVGRSDSCDLPIDDGLVSRRHAMLLVDTDWMTIEDLGSYNGVIVNGKRIAAPRQLQHGDRIRLGLHEMQIVEEGVRRKARTITAQAVPGVPFGIGGRRPKAGETGETTLTDLLSPREREVLSLVAQGHTNKRIAEILGVGEKTVETHRARLSHKLGARDRAELVRVALQAGLLERGD